jgi:HEAT repeat protein
MNTTRRSLQAWRALSFVASSLAIALVLWPTPAARTVRRADPAPIAVVEQPTTPDFSESLSGVHERTEGDDQAALDSLIAICEHATPQVASAALNGIVQIGGTRARTYLAQRFGSGKASEVSELAQALAQLGDPEATAVLLQAARSERVPVREAAREALASLDTPEARSFMLEELSGPDSAQAIAYFADCVDARAVTRLEGLARDSTADVRSSAIAALFAQGESAYAAIERLLQGDEEVANDVLELPAPTARLRQAQRAASIARLRAGALTTGNVFNFLARDLSSAAREALVQSARDPASAESATNALTTRGDSASLGALSRLADDSDPGLASRAVCALVTAPDSRTHPFLLRAERKLPSQAAAALQRIGAPEADAAVARLRMARETSSVRETKRRREPYGFGS